MLNRFLHLAVRRSFVKYNCLNFQPTASESRNKSTCDPVAIVAVGNGKVEHSRFRLEVLKRHKLILIAHERYGMRGDLNRQRGHVAAADNTIDRVNGGDPLVYQSEVILRRQYLAR